MFARKMFDRKMFDSKTLEQSSDAPPSRRPTGSRQHQLMVGSLVLLLAALGILLYNDRNFWFPDTQEADAEQGFPAPASAASGTPTRAIDAAHAAKKHSNSKPPTAKDTVAPAPDPPPVTAVRTALPPLQVEVVAGNVHNTLRSGTNSVHVDLQPGTTPQTLADPPLGSSSETAAGVTTNAAENVQISADTSEVVSHTVRPGYPLLARQMKVQGSVILQALINRDGSIQDLHILSGPPILASAAREAVRQWRFKPHYQGAEPVETLAKITVNFTISTN
jgi:periplasmic protein TonB